MKKHAFKFLTMVFSVLLFVASVPSFAEDMKGIAEVPQSVKVKLALRDLYSGHIFWVRNVVFATKYGNKAAAKVAEEQVVQNAKAIGESITPYYGKDASEKLFKLFAGHYGAVKDYMNATFAGKKGAQKAAVDKLTKNADELATFLSSANPNWPKDTLFSALVAHGGHHIAQIDDLSKKDFDSEAKIWETMKEHMYVISDLLADGILKQFPEKFMK
ncbi:MAG: hypothetical protein HQK92_01240 [Nitrospirae bacterium]|nr:hypothetical protein [Nitrospirota bacterium]